MPVPPGSDTSAASQPGPQFNGETPRPPSLAGSMQLGRDEQAGEPKVGLLEQTGEPKVGLLEQTGATPSDRSQTCMRTSMGSRASKMTTSPLLGTVVKPSEDHVIEMSNQTFQVVSRTGWEWLEELKGQSAAECTAVGPEGSAAEGGGAPSVLHDQHNALSVGLRASEAFDPGVGADSSIHHDQCASMLVDFEAPAAGRFRPGSVPLPAAALLTAVLAREASTAVTCMEVAAPVLTAAPALAPSPPEDFTPGDIVEGGAHLPVVASGTAMKHPEAVVSGSLPDGGTHPPAPVQTVLVPHPGALAKAGCLRGDDVHQLGAVSIDTALPTEASALGSFRCGGKELPAAVQIDGTPLLEASALRVDIADNIEGTSSCLANACVSDRALPMHAADAAMASSTVNGLQSACACMQASPHASHAPFIEHVATEQTANLMVASHIVQPGQGAAGCRELHKCADAVGPAVHSVIAQTAVAGSGALNRCGVDVTATVLPGSSAVTGSKEIVADVATGNKEAVPVVGASTEETVADVAACREPASGCLRHVLQSCTGQSAAETGRVSESSGKCVEADVAGEDGVQAGGRVGLHVRGDAKALQSRMVDDTGRSCAQAAETRDLLRGAAAGGAEPFPGQRAGGPELLEALCGLQGSAQELEERVAGVQHLRCSSNVRHVSRRDFPVIVGPDEVCIQKESGESFTRAGCTPEHAPRVFPDTPKTSPSGEGNGLPHLAEGSKGQRMAGFVDGHHTRDSVKMVLEEALELAGLSSTAGAALEEGDQGVHEVVQRLQADILIMAGAVAGVRAEGMDEQAQQATTPSVATWVANVSAEGAHGQAQQESSAEAAGGAATVAADQQTTERQLAGEARSIQCASSCESLVELLRRARDAASIAHCQNSIESLRRGSTCGHRPVINWLLQLAEQQPLGGGAVATAPSASTVELQLARECISARKRHHKSRRSRRTARLRRNASESNEQLLAFVLPLSWAGDVLASMHRQELPPQQQNGRSSSKGGEGLALMQTACASRVLRLCCSPSLSSV
jgi:hypothetical protein